MKALILLLSLTLLQSTSASNVFVSNDTFYHVSLEPLTWFAAQEVPLHCKLLLSALILLPQYCWAMGGYLAELTTMKEDIPLENYLVQGIAYWIGLSDTASEGTWRWMESHQNANYTNWWTGQGDDGTSQNCAFKSLHPS